MHHHYNPQTNNNLLFLKNINRCDIYNNGILLIKRNEILPFVTTRIDQEGIVLSEIDRERQIPYGFTHMWNPKNETKNKKKQK